MLADSLPLEASELDKHLSSYCELHQLDVKNLPDIIFIHVLVLRNKFFE